MIRCVFVAASVHGLGTCLVQGGRTVIWAARKITPARTRWAQMEKELLGVYHKEAAKRNTPARRHRSVLKLQIYK